MDYLCYCTTKRLCNELVCGLWSAYPENGTAQHNHSALGKNHSANSRKTTVETLGKSTVAKWQTRGGTLIEPQNHNILFERGFSIASLKIKFSKIIQG